MPHETTLLIRPEFLNHGGTLFGGYMMQWADDMAYSAASLAFPSANFVTKLFGQFDFKAPVRSGDIIKIYSNVERFTATSKVAARLPAKSRCGRSTRERRWKFFALSP